MIFAVITALPQFFCVIVLIGSITGLAYLSVGLTVSVLSQQASNSKTKGIEKNKIGINVLQVISSRHAIFYFKRSYSR